MTPPPYALGFQSLDEEVTDRKLPVDGEIPSWLSGSLIRNGPGTFEAGGQRFAHWFDGLAMLRKYDFADGAVRYTNRFLRSEAYADAQEGRASGQFATGVGGLRSAIGWLRRLGPPEPTDNANVHVAALDGSVVALTEVPRWTAVDRETLATEGRFAFADDLGLHTTTAHLARDPHRGEHLGFGLEFGRTHEYRVFRIPDGTRRREEIATIETADPAYVHDCVATAGHVVLLETPLRIDVLRALSPFTDSFFDLLDWRPAAGTRFLVVDRETGAVTRFPVENCFSFHSVNAFADGDEVVVDLVAYDDATIVDALSLDALASSGFEDVPSGRLVRYRLDPTRDGAARTGGVVSRTSLYEGMELPTVPPAVRCRPYRYAYGQATDREGANGLAKVDVTTGTAQEWWEAGVYVEEPRMVQRPGADAPDDGVVLAPALSVEDERALLLVFDASTLTEVARAPLPHHQPFAFHGRFFPSP